MSFDRNYFNAAFSHIYVEEAVRDNPDAVRIVDQFPDAERITISHYKDVFCRSRQNYGLQHRAQKLILAEKKGQLLYAGAPVCQSFGAKHFFYTSCVMNCIYDCEYCYLKGMYPSGNLVVFVNLDDFFNETDALLRIHPVYLCISYDTDLLALEGVAGYVKRWCGFAAERDGLLLEVRTKCAPVSYFKGAEPLPNVIYAFTISPDAVTGRYEHGTPSMRARLACAAAALKAGFRVRLCFDPMIHVPDWKARYGKMLEAVREEIPVEKLADVSVGSFRISQEYLKNMRKNEPASVIAQFPYQNDGGYYHYPDPLMRQMEQYLVGALGEMIPRERIFLW